MTLLRTFGKFQGSSGWCSSKSAQNHFGTKLLTQGYPALPGPRHLPQVPIISPQSPLSRRCPDASVLLTIAESRLLVYSYLSIVEEVDPLFTI